MYVHLLQPQEEPNAAIYHHDRAKVTTQKGEGRCYQCVSDQSWCGICSWALLCGGHHDFGGKHHFPMQPAFPIWLEAFPISALCVCPSSAKDTASYLVYNCLMCWPRSDLLEGKDPSSFLLGTCHIVGTWEKSWKWEYKKENVSQFIDYVKTYIKNAKGTAYILCTRYTAKCLYLSSFKTSSGIGAITCVLYIGKWRLREVTHPISSNFPDSIEASQRVIYLTTSIPYGCPARMYHIQEDQRWVGYLPLAKILNVKDI